jgi:hypothetical protein
VAQDDRLVNIPRSNPRFGCEPIATFFGKLDEPEQVPVDIKKAYIQQQAAVLAADTERAEASCSSSLLVSSLACDAAVKPHCVVAQHWQGVCVLSLGLQTSQFHFALAQSHWEGTAVPGIARLAQATLSYAGSGRATLLRPHGADSWKPWP